MAHPRRKSDQISRAPLDGVFAALALIPPSGRGKPLDDACQLFEEVQALFRESPDPAGECHRLFLPLSRVVAAQRSRCGQEACAELFVAIAMGDQCAALDASRRLIEFAAAGAP